MGQTGPRQPRLDAILQTPTSPNLSKPLATPPLIEACPFKLNHDIPNGEPFLP